MTRIEDVARAAGVSVASVSRVISGARQVRPKTREAVLEAVKKLGYQTNFMASSLRRQSTRTIGMVVPYIANPFFIELVEKVENAVQEAGYDLFLCDSQDSPEIEKRRIRALIARQVDGIVLICCDETLSRESVKSVKDDVPIVAVDRTIRDVPLDNIAVDSELGIRMVIDHLAEQGFRKMAFVGASGGISTAQARLDAYQRYVVEVDPPSANDVKLGSYSVDWGRKVGFELAQRPRLPDAVVCANDLIAVGVIRGLRRSAVQIPDDMAVTGFDDIALCRYVEPSITTVRQPVDKMGVEAANLLLARIDGNDGSLRDLRFSPELVIRQSSCRTPPPAHP